VSVTGVSLVMLAMITKRDSLIEFAMRNDASSQVVSEVSFTLEPFLELV